jgi:flagellar hook-associated protein 1 FlgK
MSNLLASLSVTAGALNAFDVSLATTQANVANAQTPGYAAQRQTLQAQALNISRGEIGGVIPGVVMSARNQFAESNVHYQNQQLGQASQDATTLSQIQNMFPVSGNTGVANVLNGLYSAFSNWASIPNDNSARQNVINNASSVVLAFQQTAQGLTQIAQQTTQQVGYAITNINNIATQLAKDNQLIQNGDINDAGLDANIHATLDQLSQYVNFTATQQPDGTTTVLLDGQTPLVMGSNSYSLNSTLVQPQNPPPVNANAPNHVAILDSHGNDITSQVTSGQLGSLINTQNNVLPQYMGDGYQNGSLNTLAQSFADTVNTLLTNGYISNGPPPQSGVPLFTYDTTNPTNVANSLALDPTVTASQLAAIQPGPPQVANGTALALAGLAQQTGQINGQSFTGYYANIASNVGTALNIATGQQSAQQAALAQAQNMRNQVSGVDLNQEAVSMVEFQRAYEANSRFVSVINDITGELINMMGN